MEKRITFIGSAPPKIYSVKEDQFIIVQSTGSDSLRTGYQIKMGDALVAFKLKNNGEQETNHILHIS